MKKKEKGIDVNKLTEKILKLPGVKVNREEFLRSKFSKRVNQSQLVEILEKGPYEAGIKKDEIDNIAKSIIQKRTLMSSSMSFGAGIPGGWALAGTIPGDVSQFLGMAFRLAQELAYIYGHNDFWLEEHLDTEKARNNMILYLGTMFGVGGSTSAIKFISSGISKAV